MACIHKGNSQPNSAASDKFPKNPNAEAAIPPVLSHLASALALDLRTSAKTLHCPPKKKAPIRGQMGRCGDWILLRCAPTLPTRPAIPRPSGLSVLDSGTLTTKLSKSASRNPAHSGLSLTITGICSCLAKRRHSSHRPPYSHRQQPPPERRLTSRHSVAMHLGRQPAWAFPLGQTLCILARTMPALMDETKSPNVLPFSGRQAKL